MPPGPNQQNERASAGRVFGWSLRLLFALLLVTLLAPLPGALAKGAFSALPAWAALGLGAGVLLVPAVFGNGFLTWLRQKSHPQAAFLDTFAGITLLWCAAVGAATFLLIPDRTARDLRSSGRPILREALNDLGLARGHSLSRSADSTVEKIAALYSRRGYMLRQEQSRKGRAVRKRTSRSKVGAVAPRARTATRVAARHLRGRTVRPGPRRRAPGRRPQPVPGPAGKYRLPFQRMGNSMIVTVTLNDRRRVKLLLDTGASYTTISSRFAQRFGIIPTAGAPSVVFRTANGLVRSRLGLLRSLTIAGARLSNVAYSVCRSCGDRNVVGLLGMNVTGRFKVTIDNATQVVELVPGAQFRAHHPDIAPFVVFSALKGVTIRSLMGRTFKLTGRATNRSPLPIRDAILRLVYVRGTRSVGTKRHELGDIEPGESLTFHVTDRRPPVFVKFRPELAKGTWGRAQ